ncbi:MAG TPA: histidine phosphatase family protein [Dehalococcoidia bacterium]|nr:histidine phosphatase family protein [Dehalococcoidia bacterium]
MIEDTVPDTSPLLRPRPALLVVVRHGESLRNTYDVHSGLQQMPPEIASTPDHLIPLTAEGERQARCTGEGLRAEFGAFDTIYHSPWLRTTQTAHLIAEALPAGAALRRNLFLTEQHFGQLDPAIWPQRLQRYEAAYKLFELQREIMGRFYCRPPDGESWADVCIRTHQFLGILFRPEHAGKRVLLITHGVTQQSFRYHLEYPTEEQLVEEYERDRNRNCGVGAYTHSPQTGWTLLYWNKTYF